MSMIFRRVVEVEEVPAGTEYSGSTATFARWAETMVCGHVAVSAWPTANGRRRCRECETERDAWGESVYDEQQNIAMRSQMGLGL